MANRLITFNLTVYVCMYVYFSVDSQVMIYVAQVQSTLIPFRSCVLYISCNQSLWPAIPMAYGLVTLPHAVKWHGGIHAFFLHPYNTMQSACNQ